jgi:hypothetical protein
MIIETLRKDILLRMLGINRHATLEKELQLLDRDKIVGYTVKGNSISEIDYFSGINLSVKDLESGTLETYTSDVVRSKILGQ